MGETIVLLLSLLGELADNLSPQRQLALWQRFRTKSLAYVLAACDACGGLCFATLSSDRGPVPFPKGG